MTRLMVKVSNRNKGFILYNHLFQKKDPFTIKELRQELIDNYGLEVTDDFLKHSLEEYIDSGLVRRKFQKFVSAID